jgi:hypothetical protein
MSRLRFDLEMELNLKAKNEKMYAFAQTQRMCFCEWNILKNNILMPHKYIMSNLLISQGTDDFLAMNVIISFFILKSYCLQILLETLFHFVSLSLLLYCL